MKQTLQKNLFFLAGKRHPITATRKRIILEIALLEVETLSLTNLMKQ